MMPWQRLQQARERTERRRKARERTAELPKTLFMFDYRDVSRLPTYSKLRREDAE